MEKLRQNLWTFLKEKPMSTKEKWIKKCFACLDVLRKQKICHFDCTVKNFFVDKNNVFLGDFTLARDYTIPHTVFADEKNFRYTETFEPYYDTAFFRSNVERYLNYPCEKFLDDDIYVALQLKYFSDHIW